MERSRFTEEQIIGVVRKAEERTVSGLWTLIGNLVDIFQPQ